MKPTEIKQHDITDCGATCLASVAAHYGLQMPIAHIRQLASTDKKGTNVLGMLEAAEKIGFAAKGVKATRTDGNKNIDPLYKIPKPAIAHVVIKERLQHFVVIYGVSGKHIEVMDPATGKLEKRMLADFVKEWTGILILLVPDDNFKCGSEKVSITQRFWFLLQPHKKMLIQALFGSLIYTILGLSTSIYVQKIIDYVIPDVNGNLLNLLSIVMVTLLLLSLFINYVKTVIMFKSGLQIDARLILGYYKHLLKLPQAFFDNMRSGEIISRVNDAVKIRAFINETMINFIIDIFIVCVSFALMFTYYWKLAVVMLLIIPLYTGLYYLYNRMNKLTQRRLMENYADLEAQLVESINAAGTIKRFGIEEFANLKTETRFVKMLRTVYTSGINSLWTSTGTELFARTFTIVLLWYGSYFVLDNTITPGELLSFYTLIGYFTGPIGSLVGMNRVVQDARIAADRLFEIMDLEQENTGKHMNLTREQIGDIEFMDVSFRYGSRVDVFQHFNVRFRQGQVSAIVGESGSGKTTLMALLQNLYPLQDGQIKIGGIDISHVNNANLRELVGVVPQRIDLFEGTVASNITLDDFEPDWQQMIDICRNIGILDFIENMPAGFDTNIGENGIKLSGGQRQRLAIARAIYRNPEILILDEATSALDSESEQNIKRVIEQLKVAGKTIIIIAHRLGTVMNADRIFVLSKGKLMEEGTHTELLASESLYRCFWKTQTTLM